MISWVRWLALAGAFVLSVTAAAAETRVVISMIANEPTAELAAVLMDEAYRRIGVEMVAEPLPAWRALDDALAGITDGDMARVAAVEQLAPNLIRVPEPVLHNDIYVFTHGAQFPIDGIASLSPYLICVVRGIKVYDDLTQSMRRVMTDNLDHSFQLLARDRCDVAMFTERAWLTIDQLGVGHLRMLRPSVFGFDLYHYLNRRYAALVPALADALRDMRADGTTDRLLAADRARIDGARRLNGIDEK